MGLRDKLRSKKSGDKKSSGGAPPSAEPPFPSAAAPAAAPARQERVQPLGAPSQRRAANSAAQAELETEKEVMSQIMAQKRKIEDVEKRMTFLETKKAKALSELAAIRALPVLDKPKHDRLAREVKRTKADLADCELSVRNMESTIDMMQQRLRQKTELAQSKAVLDVAQKVTVDADEVERQQEIAQDLVAETADVRTRMHQMPVGMEDDFDLDDEITQELALHEQNEKLRAEAAAAQASPGAIAAIQGAEATPTLAPGPIATTMASTSSAAQEEEDALAKLEQQIAM